MELYLKATSPYARLVRIVLIEKGLTDVITLKWCDPWADDPGYSRLTHSILWFNILSAKMSERVVGLILSAEGFDQQVSSYLQTR